PRCLSGERSARHEPVRLVDLSGAERLAGCPQLRARREQGHARAPGTAHLGESDGSQRTELRRRQTNARWADRFAAPNVAATWPHVVTRGNTLRQFDDVVMSDNSLDGD